MFDWIRLCALAENGSKKSTCNYTVYAPAGGSRLLESRECQSPEARIKGKL